MKTITHTIINKKTGLQHKICNPAKYSIILITIQFSLQGLHLPVR